MGRVRGGPGGCPFIGGVQTPAMVWRTMCAVAGAWTINGFSMFSVLEKASGRWIGRLGPWMPIGWPGTEVGWALAREAWGKGYAVEGAAAAMDWAFDGLGWSDVIHAIDPANTRSANVARRLGSAHLRDAVLPIHSTCRSRSGVSLARAGGRGRADRSPTRVFVADRNQRRRGEGENHDGAESQCVSGSSPAGGTDEQREWRRDQRGDHVLERVLGLPTRARPSVARPAPPPR